MSKQQYAHDLKMMMLHGPDIELLQAARYYVQLIGQAYAYDLPTAEFNDAVSHATQGVSASINCHESRDMVLGVLMLVCGSLLEGYCNNINEEQSQ